MFTYASDLWTAKREGGLARRITSHPGQETRARISPDGKFVAFSGEYDGNVDVFVVPIEGGEPKRLSYDPVPDLVLDWTPDGKIAYKSLAGTFNSKQPRMWVVDPKGGLPTASALQEVSDGSFSPDGKSMAFNRVSSHQFNWRRYRGGTQGRISLYEFATNKYSELPSKGENSWHPMWIGNAVYYASDRNQGTVNLYKYDLGNRQDRQLTTYADADIKWPASDGKSIVFERDGYLHAEVESAFYKVEQASRSVRIFQNTVVPQAEQSLMASHAAYENNNVDFLMLLDSQRTLRDLKLAAHQALADFGTRLAELEFAVGIELINK